MFSYLYCQTLSHCQENLFLIVRSIALHFFYSVFGMCSEFLCSYSAAIIYTNKTQIILQLPVCLTLVIQLEYCLVLLLILSPTQGYNKNTFFMMVLLGIHLVFFYPFPVVLNKTSFFFLQNFLGLELTIVRYLEFAKFLYISIGGCIKYL